MIDECIIRSSEALLRSSPESIERVDNNGSDIADNICIEPTSFTFQTPKKHSDVLTQCALDGSYLVCEDQEELEYSTYKVASRKNSPLLRKKPSVEGSESINKTNPFLVPISDVSDVSDGERSYPVSRSGPVEERPVRSYTSQQMYNQPQYPVSTSSHSSCNQKIGFPASMESFERSLLFHSITPNSGSVSSSSLSHSNCRTRAFSEAARFPTSSTSQTFSTVTTSTDFEPTPSFLTSYYESAISAEGDVPLHTDSHNSSANSRSSLGRGCMPSVLVDTSTLNGGPGFVSLSPSTADMSPYYTSSDTSLSVDLKVSRTYVGKPQGRDNDVSIEKLESGEETRTCVMLRNLPNKYRRDDIVRVLYGVVGEHFNIVKMPLDANTGRNLGYCFIQFTSVDDLIYAYYNLQNRSWPNSESVKKCRFCYAKIQGDKHKNSSIPVVVDEFSATRMPNSVISQRPACNREFGHLLPSNSREPSNSYPFDNNIVTNSNISRKTQPENWSQNRGNIISDRMSRELNTNSVLSNIHRCPMPTEEDSDTCNQNAFSSQPDRSHFRHSVDRVRQANYSEYVSEPMERDVSRAYQRPYMRSPPRVNDDRFHSGSEQRSADGNTRNCSGHRNGAVSSSNGGRRFSCDYGYHKNSVNEEDFEVTTKRGYSGQSNPS